MKNRQRLIACAVLLFLALTMTTGFVFATEPSVYSLDGAPNYGPMAKEKNTIKLEGEKLIYNIVDFPFVYGENDDAPASRSSLTAEYSLINTDTEQQSITLYSPITYSYRNYVHSEVVPSFSLNGEAIQPIIRHSYTTWRNNFDDRELSRIYDEYLTSTEFTDDLTVTKYIVSISNIGFPRDNYAYLICTTENYENTERAYFLNTKHSKYADDYRNDYLVSSIKGDATVELYVFGPKSDKLPTFGVYYSYTSMKSGDSPYLSDIDITEAETLTLYEFIMQNYDPDGEISEMDWHNLVMTELSGQKVSGHAITLNGYIENYETCVRKWYETTITLDAGERVKYTTVMPLYPDEVIAYSPSPYCYRYLNANIDRIEGCEVEYEINSPYYLLNSEQYKNSVRFELCEVENPSFEVKNPSLGNQCITPAIDTIINILLLPLTLIVRFFEWLWEIIQKLLFV